MQGATTEVDEEGNDLRAGYPAFRQPPRPERAPVKPLKELTHKVKSGRRYVLDSLTSDQVHCFVTDGPGVVPLTHDEYADVKEIKKLADTGEAAYRKQDARASVVQMMGRNKNNTETFLTSWSRWGSRATWSTC